jgi:outer membrane protein, heavy metal efflux system
MKIASVLILFALATSVAAEDRVRAFTPAELVSIALADNPELHFYEQQVSALPKPSSAKPLPTIAQPLDFPSRESFRRAVLNLDASLARLYLALFRFVLAGTVRIKAMEYQAASASAITANDLASRISALVTMLEGRPAAGVEALIERRILEGAALPFLRKAAEAKVRGDLLRRELNGLLGRPPDEELSVTGELALPPELVDQAPDDPLLLQIREAEIARGLVGLDVAGITRPGTTAGSTIADTTIRLVEDARTKCVRETAQRRAAVKAARELAAAIPPELIENLRGASDLAERQYRVGALGVNLLIEAHREYLEALESRNQAVIQAWRNSLDLDMLNLPAAPNWLGKVIVSPNGTP